jgi:hypothetical protein
MTARKLVRIVYYKRKKYYLITPCVTINEVDYGYSMPVTKVESNASYGDLYGAAIDVMKKDCRMPDSAEAGWVEYARSPAPLFDKRLFRKEFGYHYGSLVKTATSIIMMEHLPDDSYVFEMWSTDGMSKETMVCPAGSSRDEAIAALAEALKKSEANRAARPKYY